MKKIFTLAAAVLASMAMMADPVYKSDFSAFSDDENGGYYTDLKTNTYASFITDGWMSYVGSSTGSATLQIDPKDDSAITGKSASYGKVKANGSRHMEFYVTNVSSIKFYFANSGSSDRKIQYILNDGTATDLVTVVQKTSDFGSIALDATTNNKIRIFSPDNDVYVCALKVTPLLGPSIKSIQIAGVDCEIVKAADAADPDTIKGELPYGTVVADAVAAITTDDFVLGGTATSLRVPYPYTSVYARDDDGNEKEYFIACTVNASASADATLKSLKINGVDVEGFAADVLEYEYEIAYAAELPVVTAEANDVAAKSVVITDVTAVPGTATIVVTAQNDATLTYSIAFTRKAAATGNAITSFKIAGLVGAIDAENHAIAVNFADFLGEVTALEPVIAISELATIDKSGVQDFSEPVVYTVTSEAGESQEWTVTVNSIAVPTLAKNNMPYAPETDWTATPEWMFIADGAYTENYQGGDYKDHNAIRINLAGAVYMNLAACDSIVAIASATGTRNYRLEVLGDSDKAVQLDNKAKNTAWELKLNVASENPVIVKFSTPGANGGATLRMVNVFWKAKSATALDNTDAAVKAEKVIREGQVLIIRDGKTFNVLGARVR